MSIAVHLRTIPTPEALIAASRASAQADRLLWLAVNVPDDMGNRTAERIDEIRQALRDALAALGCD